jgi:hypothetical protein
MQQKNLLFEESAVEETLKELRCLGFRWRHIHYINKGRYALVTGRDGSPNIAILLKTEPFFNFGAKFKKQGTKGVGDSINVEQLKEFARNKVKFIYVKFRDGKLYVIPFVDFIEKSFEWIQKEGTKVRSISIHEYKRVNV